MNKKNQRRTSGRRSPSSPKASLFTVLIIVIMIVFGIPLTLHDKTGPVDKDNKTAMVVEIPEGSSSGSIADILKDKNLIKSKNFFKLKVKLSNKAEKFKAGTYSFNKSMNNDQIIDMLAEGKMVKDGIKVTIPEGATSFEIADTLLQKRLIKSKDEFLKEVSNANKYYDKHPYLKEANVKSLEGFLYPETYFIKKNSSVEDICNRLLTEFDKNFKNQDFKYDPKDLNKIVILASIVEKEAAGNGNMDKIASVFYNRLKINMPLQSDATIQYALPERKKIVSYDDLKVNSLYNTYKHKGLPPSAISNPSIDAMKAAISPAKTDYLFFVDKPGGGTNFAKTFEEHKKYVKEYKDDRDKKAGKNKQEEKSSGEMQAEIGQDNSSDLRKQKNDR